MAGTRAPKSLQIYDPVLTNLARQYKPTGFIADQLLANQPTDVLSAQYPVFDKAYWFQVQTDNEVTDRTPTREVDFEWSTESFLCKEYGLKVGWTDLEAQQAHGALRLTQNKTDMLSHQMALAHEIRVANLLRKTTNNGMLNLGATPSTNWDQDAATIEADIKTGVLAMYDLGVPAPNVIVIPYKVAYAMALQEDIRALLRSDATGRGVDYISLGSRILPAVIHGMKVLIPSGQVSTAQESQTANNSITISEIWGDHVRLLYVDSSAGYGTPSVAYKFTHTDKKVTRWRTVDPDINYIRQFERYALKVVAPDAGYELTALLS
jgi:hypothetical protein